ncbi:MAG TPA: extracellular solute-binding protein [Limnochordia bacterium]
MHSKRPQAWLLFIALVLLLTAPVCAAAIEINVVGGGDGFSDAEDQAGFYEAHPGIQINILNNVSNAQVLAMIAAGTPPDLIRTEARQVPYWVSFGLLEDLTPYIRSRSQFIRPGDLVPVNDLYRVDGGIYALNKDWSADLTIYYNKDLFDAAGLSYPSETTPLTYTEVMELSRKLSRQEGGEPVQWGFGAGYMPLAYQAMLRAVDQPFYSPDQTRAMLADNPEALEAADWWVEMARRQWYGGPNDPWHNARLAMYQMGFWFGPVAAVGGRQNVYANERSEEGSTEMIGFAPAPRWGEKRVNMAVATGFAMFADSPHKDEAWQVLEWFMVGPPAIRRTRIGWGIPPLRSLFQYIPQETELDRQRYRVTVAEVPYLAPHYPNRYDAAAFDQAWNQWFGPASSGEISTNEFLRRVEQDTNNALARAAAQ